MFLCIEQSASACNEPERQFKFRDGLFRQGFYYPNHYGGRSSDSELFLMDVRSFRQVANEEPKQVIKVTKKKFWIQLDDQLTQGFRALVSINRKTKIKLVHQWYQGNSGKLIDMEDELHIPTLLTDRPVTAHECRTFKRYG